MCEPRDAILSLESRNDFVGLDDNESVSLPRSPASRWHSSSYIPASTSSAGKPVSNSPGCHMPTEPSSVA